MHKPEPDQANETYKIILYWNTNSPPNPGQKIRSHANYQEENNIIK